VREARRTSEGAGVRRAERGTDGLGFGAAVAEAWTVPLPRDIREPFEVYVNGVPQQRGVDYEVDGGTLRFRRPLAKEGRLGLLRWTSMFLGVAGTYRKNDSVDVVYELGGRRVVASGLPIVPPAKE
jgi:hypothetical protein